MLEIPELPSFLQIPTMQSILSSFHLNIRTFSELLHATNSVVAGSAALAAQVAETPYKFTPNDLDIWVHSDFFPPQSVGLAPPEHPAVAVRHGYQFLFAYFLKQHGYVEVDRPVQSDAEYTSNPVFAILRCIQRFQHSASGRVVQVMHCKVPVENLLDSFDLSVAQTWWVPSLHPQHSEGFLYSADREAAKVGLMYLLREATTEREKTRIKKYEERGFSLVERDAVRLHMLAQVAEAVAEQPANPQ